MLNGRSVAVLSWHHHVPRIELPTRNLPLVYRRRYCYHAAHTISSSLVIVNHVFNSASVKVFVLCGHCTLHAVCCMRLSIAVLCHRQGRFSWSKGPVQHPSSSNGLQPDCNGLHPETHSDGLQPSTAPMFHIHVVAKGECTIQLLAIASNPIAMASDLILLAMVSNLVVMASNYYIIAMASHPVAAHMFHKCFTYVSHMFHICFIYVSHVFHICYIYVSHVFQYVSHAFDMCYDICFQ